MIREIGFVEVGLACIIEWDDEKNRAHLYESGTKEEGTVDFPAESIEEAEKHGRYLVRSTFGNIRSLIRPR
jgi:hypothetical protein